MRLSSEREPFDPRKELLAGLEIVKNGKELVENGKEIHGATKRKAVALRCYVKTENVETIKVMKTNAPQ